jgi:hypothetical protein
LIPPVAVDLAGRLQVRPGVALPTIVSSRREWAAAIGRGRPTEALPGLLASVYTLCGGAHRIASRHALDAALQLDPAVGDGPRRDLQIDTLREHLRRLWLDAPRQVPALPPPDPAELARCPLLRRDAGEVDSSRGWIEQQVLGAGAADWLAGWSAGPAAFAASWAAAGATWPARWLHGVRRLCADAHEPVRPLQAQSSALELERLADRLRRDPGFALAPTWRGQCVETGCWTRVHDRVALGSASPYAELWLRHAARVADVARLLLPDGAHWLAQGRLPLAGPLREGLGWCEMARGLLVHWVQLDAQGRVADCRLIAPTEWNFHPFGAAARVLSRLPRKEDELRVQVLMGAYDPCVVVECDPGADQPHA